MTTYLLDVLVEGLCGAAGGAGEAGGRARVGLGLRKLHGVVPAECQGLHRAD